MQYPHIFEEEVLASIKNWVVEDSPKPAVEGPNGMAICHSTRNCFTTSDAMDREILRTYATGLLAVALGGYHYSPNLFTSIDRLGFCCIARFIWYMLTGEDVTIKTKPFYWFLTWMSSEHYCQILCKSLNLWEFLWL